MYEKVDRKCRNMKTMFEKIKRMITRELIIYGIVGVCTTAVNLSSFHLICNVLGVTDLVSNVYAWVIAVIFAYITNDLVVFKDKHGSFTVEFLKIVKFFVARLLSLGIEQLGLLIFVKKMGIYNMLVKVVLAIIVILLNYVFSKLYIFNHNKKSS